MATAVLVPVKGSLLSTRKSPLVVEDVVDLESMPLEVEEGMRARRVVQYDQWMKIDAEGV